MLQITNLYIGFPQPKPKIQRKYKKSFPQAYKIVDF